MGGSFALFIRTRHPSRCQNSWCKGCRARSSSSFNLNYILPGQVECFITYIEVVVYLKRGSTRNASGKEYQDPSIITHWQVWAKTAQKCAIFIWTILTRSCLLHLRQVSMRQVNLTTNACLQTTWRRIFARSKLHTNLLQLSISS